MPDIRVKAKLTGGVINTKAELGRMVEVPVGPDVYDGPYLVTVADDTTLPTSGKLMAEDLELVYGRDIDEALLSASATIQIEEYYNPDITELRPYAFSRVTAFRVIKLPNLRTLINSSEGLARTGAEEIYIPRTSGQSWNSSLCFNNNLRILDLGEITITNVLRENPNLEILILRNSRVQTSVSSLNGTKLLDEGGIVYVPQNLVTAYPSNSSWAPYADIIDFRPIEGSEYELEE